MMCHLCWSQTVDQSWFKEIWFAGRPTRTRWVDLQSCFSGCLVRTSSFIISVSHPENPETVTWEDPTDQQLSCQSSKSPSAEQNWIKLWPKTAFHRFCCPTLSHILKILLLHLSPCSPPLHWSPMYGTSLLPSHCRRGLHHFLLFDIMQQQDLSFLVSALSF